MKRACLLAIVSICAVACGGTVVFEEDGGGGNGGNGNGNGNGNGSTATASNANANAGTAGPGGVGGADSGASLSKSSSGVGGTGCVYLEEGTTHCYSHRTCEGGIRETECELGEGPRPCWCFLDGAFVGQCEEQDSWCGAQSQCCDALWP